MNRTIPMKRCCPSLSRSPLTALLVGFSLTLLAGVQIGVCDEPSRLYLKDWLLCGPFPATTESAQDIDVIRLPGMYTDWLKEHGGESKAGMAFYHSWSRR